MVKILAFNGSLRADSWNYKLVCNAGRAAEKAGAKVSYLHLKDLPMPVLSEDLESAQGMPVNAGKFKQMLIAHDGFLIASPEYNGSISAALKNALDWASRKENDEPSLLAFKGKTASLLSASPGQLGGVRGLVHLRAILGNLGVFVLPQQYSMSQAFKQFDSDNNISGAKDRDKIDTCVNQLLDVCNKLYSSKQ